MLSTDFDIFAMVDAIKNIKRFLAAPAFEGYVEGPFGAFAQAKTDAELEAYVRAETTTILHATGTASMAKTSSNDGVVNPDLTVKGADGLRIVDASVFVSFIICYLLREYTATHLLDSHSFPAVILKVLSTSLQSVPLILLRVLSSGWAAVCEETSHFPVFFTDHSPKHLMYTILSEYLSHTFPDNSSTSYSI